MRIIIKENEKYICYLSGDNYDYLSIIIPTGVPVAIQNIGKEDAFIINLPTPAWTPEMNDEHTANFSDFDFKYEKV